MLAKDGVDFLLHEGPGHLRALQWALVSAGAIGLFAALLDDGVPAAGEAELVEGVGRALHKVGVLQLAPAVRALQQRCPISRQLSTVSGPVT